MRKKDPTATAMGAAAPAWGSSPEVGKLPGFLAGTWCRRMPQSNLPGMGELDKQNAELSWDDIYEFTPDGKFTYYQLSEALPWKLAGTWAGSGETIQLTVQSIDGKPIQQAMDEAHKRAEGGTQGGIAGEIFLENLKEVTEKYNVLVLGPDKKTLVFLGKGLMGETMPIGELHRVKIER